ncbi:ubiquinol-cytochrome c reductase iron-sulfur subunit [Aquihabitans sp. McL0605]|uniref:QcrA and Rieske domain-containing protein n=1 Tax=Aquihabitans sp. McL0605 TaxID=3415671 RepID=UPI003CEC0D5A
MSDPPDRLEVAVAASFLVTTAAGVGLAVVYWNGGQTQLEGLLLAVALYGLAVGIGLWAKHAMGPGDQVEAREPLRSSDEDRRAVAADFDAGERILGRRGLLLKLLAVGVGTLGGALLFPVRSLGPRPGHQLSETPWRRNRRLVTSNGDPVRPGDLPLDGVVTVFPEGDPSPGDAQTVLIRLPAGVNRPRPGRAGWTAAGCIAYSKVCTHAGCPVGLYEAEARQLVCPCHQSLFDVTDGARPTFGPATRSLPQLPLDLDADGYLVAQHDFDEPVGPAWWGTS